MFAALVTAALVLAVAGCGSLSPPAGISAVTPFDLARYEGRWYEAARLDHSFERGMTDVSSTYQRQADGSVRVVNRGFDAGKNAWRQAVGKALFTGDAQTASLKVSFFGPFYGGYHVAALDADYQWALVVGPDRGYCWILSYRYPGADLGDPRTHRSAAMNLVPRRRRAVAGAGRCGVQALAPAIAFGASCA